MLDKKRKIVLLALGFAFILYLSRPNASQAVVAKSPAAPTPVAAAAPVVEAVPAPVAAAPVPTPEGTLPVATAAHPFAAFAVYQDNPATGNHYVLSGFMPAGECVTVDPYWKENCREGQKCLEITYDTVCSAAGEGWAGAYWLEPANNWGSHPGGHDLTGAQRLVFWARGKEGGEIIDAFKVGGVTGADKKFPDSTDVTIGPVTLTKEWQQYTVDLAGKDLSHVGGGFAWVANARANPLPITFYIDDIHYE